MRSIYTANLVLCLFCNRQHSRAAGRVATSRVHPERSGGGWAHVWPDCEILKGITPSSGWGRTPIDPLRRHQPYIEHWPLYLYSVRGLPPMSWGTPLWSGFAIEPEAAQHEGNDAQRAGESDVEAQDQGKTAWCFTANVWLFLLLPVIVSGRQEETGESGGRDFLNWAALWWKPAGSTSKMF